MEVGGIVMTIVVHVDDIFAEGEKARCEQFGRDLNQMVPVKNLGEFSLVLGVFLREGLGEGGVEDFQRTFAEQLADEYGIEFGKSVPLPVGTKLAKFDKDEARGNWPFRGLVGLLMWLSTHTRPDISNAVRAVARSCSSPKLVHWRAALGI